WFRHFLPPVRTVTAAAVVGLTGYFGYGSRERVIGWADDLAHWAAPKWTPPNSFDDYAIQVAFLMVSVWVLAVLRADWKLAWIRSMGGRATFGIEAVALLIAGY